ncbi:ABC transporter ATP-binding protein/permease [Paenibacillus profundus]|uniref:ABC transporter ATP-binding protein/permease n=1 Tax=Paenibacillus profundus TaxID=1173085 RepID=A0ABS8YQ24_9BACL|nr:ABC transporter ATP-binding protein [Paenibacillus profundus]MCE5173059.1 ABC transporter ATP-binding protein/permease [Paenibacillus profundus]
MAQSKSLRFLLRLAGKQRRKLILSCLCSAASAVFALIPFVIVYRMAEGLLHPQADVSAVRQLILVACIAVLLRFALMGASTMLAHTAAFHVLYDLRVRLIEKLGKLPLGFFSTQHSGRLNKVIADDVERIESFIAHHLPDLTASIIAPLLTTAYLFAVDWRLGIAALLPIPAAFAVQGLMSAHGRRSDDMQRMHDLSETMNGAIVEFVHAMPVIKSFNQTVHSFARYRHSVESYASLWTQIARKKTPLYTLFLLLLESGLLFIMPAGVWLYGQGAITLSVLLLFLLLGVGLTAPLRQISTLGHMMQNNLEGVRRIEAVLSEEEQSVPTRSEANSPQRFDIDFRQVRFAYGEREVLKGIDLTAEHGKVTAFVGPSGAGKSTAAQLIARFFDPAAGEIRLGGFDIRSIPPEHLMDLLSFVFQDVPIVSDSVAANLRMGKEGASESDMIDAAQAAQAHDFISALPEGYNTRIGEGGVPLSGGERQRLAIARAILKNAPVLILDEAFAFADAENEAKIQDALSRLLHGKTVVVIAHRLSTIMDADRIVVFDDGQAAGIGTHDELLHSCPLYAGMWQAHRDAGEWSLEGKEESDV